MDPTTTAAAGAASATGTAAAAGDSSGSGNSALQQSFKQAIDEASKTLSISVTGQAQLNALRARPN